MTPHISEMKKTNVNMNESVCVLPDDIVLKIAWLLEVSDVCALGSCSRFWRVLCDSDCVWAPLCRDRWPHHLFHSSLQGWRGFYISKHYEMLGKAAIIVNFVEQQCLSSESIEGGHYLTAIEDLCSMKLGFKDVQMFFLNPKLNVLLNLVGLHYCISWLGVPAESVMEAVGRYKISERQVCVKWWKLGRWFHGFRMRDEYHSREVSMADLAMSKEEEVLGVLHRGAIHEVLRVQISPAKLMSTSWFGTQTW